MATESRYTHGFGARLRRLSRRLPPAISQRLDEQLEHVLERVDRWNRYLAEYSIPSDRRERIKRRGPVAGRSGARRLRVVSGDPE